MLAEKKSLLRFLLLYIVSTFTLLLAGSILYYKVTIQTIEDRQIMQMQANLNEFQKKNQKKHMIKTGIEPVYGDLPVAIYIDGKYLKGNFNEPSIILTQNRQLIGNRLYLIDSNQKRWGKLTLVTYRDIGNLLDNAFAQIVVFLLFGLGFIVVVSIMLGKMFLRPMRDTIRSLESFISDATHEINTPISNMLINIELAKELHPEIKDIEECKKVENSAFRISQIFKDLSFIKLHHKQKREITSIKLDKLINERVSFFDSMIKGKNLKLTTDISEKIINADVEDMTRIIDNLLSNAVKYTKQGGSIWVYLLDELIIKNEGSIKNTDKALGKYTRENRNEGGFGLGLHIVDKLCKHYGYTLDITSKNNITTVSIKF